MLSWFLRFCTGSDLFLGKEIIIDFTQIQGFQRRPVAHTCGCVLELSIHYDSFPDFSSEMNKVLESNRQTPVSLLYRMRYIRSTNHSAPFHAAQPITERHSTQCKQ
ncbi:hypothetical protein F7725_000146 [Dissostichus mawsoni]|uniref:Uncharacterized protein n=1 Tax=Dissostichus mawsoni TaxID=36200 RepID=A0A7J5ZFD9_DISMA|nr:hypothetical protein F7725_000146 [Dissostichus mawsoni]